MEKIVRDNMQKIYLYCVRRLENTTAAEDVASDIVLELLRSYGQIKNDEAVYGYVWGVANNLCKNYWRRSARETHEEIPEDYDGMWHLSPEESCIKEEELMLLRRELSLLREKYRQVIISYYIGGKSCEEIANTYNLSVSNVKQCLFEGRKKLKEGMDMVREYGELSYAPEKFSLNFWGSNSKGYWELFERKLPGNLMIAAYEKPKTMEELSLEMGVSVPYLEDEVVLLEKTELLVKKGKAYQSNIVLYDEQWRKSTYDRSVSMLCDKLPELKKLVDEGVSYLEKTDYCYEAADLNTRRWFILMLIMWEATHMAEEFMSTKLQFPLLANGGNGYVMGIRGEYQNNMQGIYGGYDMGQGYMRVLNFIKLSGKALNPWEHNHSVGKILQAAVERKPEPEEVAVLSELLENGFVSVREGALCPEFAMISEVDYKEVKRKLGESITMMAKLIANQRDLAGEELRKKTPAAISGANEVGAIVSMWSVLEGIVEVVLEDGYMTKGDGQNLTVFYFRTKPTVE